MDRKWFAPFVVAVVVLAGCASSSSTKVKRVLVTGDSVAITLTLGLQEAAAKNDLEIISGVAVTCAADGQKRPDPGVGKGWEAGFNSVFANDGPCVPADKLIEHYHPDMVLSIDSGVWSSPFIFAGHYGDRLAARLRLPAPHGTRLVWATIACPQAGYRRPEALVRANSQMRELAAQHPDEVSVIDLAQHVCPNDKPLQGLGNVETLRTDGLHYNVAGSELVGGWMATQLNKIAHGADGPAGGT